MHAQSFVSGYNLSSALAYDFASPMLEFQPHPLLRNTHAMTLAAALWPRRTPQLPSPQDRLFTVEPGTRILARCHWQARRTDAPALVLVHGLEGSSESPYMRTIADRAFHAGFSVLRMNQRNCGGTESLTASLYNSGLSADYRFVLEELVARDKIAAICFVGYSMGGNLVLKMAGELAAMAPPALRGICAVCPTLDLAACVEALAAPYNFLYQRNFLRGLKARMRRKTRLFPGRYDLNGLECLRTVWEFDDKVTARYCGYLGAEDYYYRASAARVMDKIHVPTLIVTAQDDPFVPYATFRIAGIENNSFVQLAAPERGGHCGFISRLGGAERYWAEARVAEFCSRLCERSG